MTSELSPLAIAKSAALDKLQNQTLPITPDWFTYSLSSALPALSAPEIATLIDDALTDLLASDPRVKLDEQCGFWLDYTSPDLWAPSLEFRTLRDFYIAAMSSQQKLTLSYRDRHGSETTRVIWPFAVGYTRLAAWCESRQDYRQFLHTGVIRVERLAATYPGIRGRHFEDWRAADLARSDDRDLAPDGC